MVTRILAVLITIKLGDKYTGECITYLDLLLIDLHSNDYLPCINFHYSIDLIVLLRKILVFISNPFNNKKILLFIINDINTCHKIKYN